MRKLLLLLVVALVGVSCEKFDEEFCGCDISGEYYGADGTQYRVNDRYEGRTCADARADSRYQVQLLRANCGYACGTGKRVTLQNAIGNGSVRLTDHCF